MKLTFTVPACAFAVYFIVEALVGLCSPLECLAQCIFVNLVVVIDKLARLLSRKVVVVSWRQLVRMPGQVYIQRGDGHLVWMSLHDVDEAVVFCEEAAHGGLCGRAVKPIELDHFVDEDALAHDGAAEVERKGRKVLPVAAHHLAGGYLGLAR